MESQDGGSLVGGQRGDGRIEGGPARARTTPGRELGAAEQALERGVAGHMDDPKRERDLLAPQPARLPLTVPPLSEVSEQATYRRRHAQPLAQHRRDLAPGRPEAVIRPYGLREPARHPQAPARKARPA
jgi:hypothetical protein